MKDAVNSFAFRLNEETPWRRAQYHLRKDGFRLLERRYSIKDRLPVVFDGTVCFMSEDEIKKRGIPIVQYPKRKKIDPEKNIKIDDYPKLKAKGWTILSLARKFGYREYWRHHKKLSHILGVIEKDIL